MISLGSLSRRLRLPSRRPTALLLPGAERRLVDRAADLAFEAEASGNAPIGAVIALDGRVIAEGRNAVRRPVRDPRRHAEIIALAAVPAELWSRAAEMTCYASLEPCPMCLQAIVGRGVGRVVYGARDFVPPRRRPPATLTWIGPVDDERSRALRRRARAAAIRQIVRRPTLIRRPTL